LIISFQNPHSGALDAQLTHVIAVTLAVWRADNFNEKLRLHVANFNENDRQIMNEEERINK